MSDRKQMRDELLVARYLGRLSLLRLCRSNAICAHLAGRDDECWRQLLEGEMARGEADDLLRRIV